MGLQVNGESTSHLSKKRSQRRSGGDVYSECLGNLESMGVPRSLSALIGNLLDCSNGDLRGDDAFASFADVQLDLQLMLARILEHLLKPTTAGLRAGEINGSSHLDQEGSGNLDEELESFLLDFSSRYDHDESHLQGVTMQEWMDKAKQDVVQGGTVASWESSKDAAEYIGAALSVALKLTECLIGAERDERNGDGNPIPLASILAGHVMIRTTAEELVAGSAGPPAHEAIGSVWIASRACTVDGLGTGRVMPRLFALGTVLYKLFSRGGVALPEKDDMEVDTPFLCPLQLNGKSTSHHFSKKGPQRRSGGDVYSGCLDNLESMGVPRSLCALIGNLLDCSNGDSRGDDAFASFADVQLDLKLMLARFLEFLSISALFPFAGSETFFELRTFT